jgi:hypothetical protein
MQAAKAGPTSADAISARGRPLARLTGEGRSPSQSQVRSGSPDPLPQAGTGEESSGGVGVDRVIRHPNSLGLLVNALGWGLAALVFRLLLARINSEKALLRAQFGAEYAAYRTRTSWLIPGVF